MLTYLNFKTKKEKVLFFIEDFKKFEENNVLLNTFTKGYCYYFALILHSRFGGNILYYKKEGHFITKIGNFYYDINGDVTEFYKNKELLNEQEFMQDNLIVYGCIDKYLKL